MAKAFARITTPAETRRWPRMVRSPHRRALCGLARSHAFYSRQGVGCPVLPDRSAHVESDRNRETDFRARQRGRRRREWLRAPNHLERFTVERRRAGGRDDAARHHAAFTIDTECDLRDAAGVPRTRRISLV